MCKDGTVQDHLTEKGCEWTFNIEKAPWWGGAFECFTVHEALSEEDGRTSKFDS